MGHSRGRSHLPSAGTRGPRARCTHNTEGLAHYGMVQDLKNVGIPDEDFALLFRSADDYIVMWERATRLSH